MGATSQTYSYNTLLSTTFNKANEKIADAIFKNSALWALLKINNRYKTVAGGAKAQIALEYGKNNTWDTLEGFTPVDLTPQDVVTSAFDRWAEAAGAISVSARDKSINRGKSKIIDYVSTLMRNCQKSGTEFMNGLILNPRGTGFAAGNGGLDPVPITAICSLAANTVHEIAEASNAWWAPQRLLGGSTGATAQTHIAFRKEAYHAYNLCSKGKIGHPDLVLTSMPYFETLWASLESQVRYTTNGGSKPSLGGIGFKTIQLLDAEVMWDEICPGTIASPGATPANTDFRAYNSATYAEECAFFLNSDYLKVEVQEGRDMAVSEFFDARVRGQLASVAVIEWMGQFLCSNRRAQGLLYGADVSAVTFS